MLPLLLSILLSLILLLPSPVHAARPAEETAPAYDLSVNVLPDAHRIDLSGTVRLPARPPGEDLILVLNERLREFRVEVVEPAASAGPAQLEQKEVVRGDVRWIVRPARPFAPGAPIVLRFSCTGGDKPGLQFDVQPECSLATPYALAWYPRLTDGLKGTGTVRYTVPDGYTVVATGDPRSAPTTASPRSFVFEVRRPMAFCFAAAHYSQSKKGGPVPVFAYLLKSRPGIEKYLDGCSRILALLQREFGPYQYRDFAIVEVPAEQASRAGFLGASVDGFIYVSSAMLDQAFAPWYFGHEITHQWWGVLIRVEGDRGTYVLSEAMAHWGALLTTEAFEGSVAAEKFRRDDGGVGYLKIAAAGPDYPLAELSNQDTAARLSWTKGFLALEMLAREVGRDRFRRVLHGVARDVAFRAITWDEFVKAVAAGAGRDIRWFMDQWFERTGAPEWRVEWKQEGQTVRGVVTQTAPLYRATIEVQVEGADFERATHELEVSDARTEFAWPVRFRVRSIVLDPHFRVLHWLPEIQGPAQAEAPFLRAESAGRQGQLDRAEEILRDALQKLPSPDRYGARFAIEYGFGRLAFERKDWPTARAHLEAALACPTRLTASVPWVYYYLARTAKELQDEPALRRAVEAAVSADAVEGAHTGAAERAKALLPAATTRS